MDDTINSPDFDGAPCQYLEPEWFFPKSSVPRAARDACAACPFREACLELALQSEADHDGFNYRHGYFGGTTPRDRDAIAKRRAA